jgi:hypothetical protein
MDDKAIVRVLKHALQNMKEGRTGLVERAIEGLIYDIERGRRDGSRTDSKEISLLKIHGRSRGRRDG